MSLLPIIIAPDPRLKKKSATVEKVDDAVRKTLDDMLETMYRANGIGLAAVQVGIHKKLIVIDIEWRDEEKLSRKPLRFINAEIVSDTGEQATYNEGCLSFPDQFSEVARPSEVTVAYLDGQGAPQTLHATGLLATCLQHEIDHTNGITFVDHISRVKREMIHNKLSKAKRMGDFDGRHHPHGHDHVHGEHCNH